MNRPSSNFTRRARTSPPAVRGRRTGGPPAASGGGCDGTDAGGARLLVPGHRPRRISSATSLAAGGWRQDAASWRETSTSGAVVLYLRTDQKTSSVNLVAVPAAPGETLDKTMAGLPELLRDEFADFTPIRGEYIFLKDVPAGRLVYEASRGGFHGKMMLVVITRGDTHYFLTYTAEPGRTTIRRPRSWSR